MQHDFAWESTAFWAIWTWKYFRLSMCRWLVGMNWWWNWWSRKSRCCGSSLIKDTSCRSSSRDGYFRRRKCSTHFDKLIERGKSLCSNGSKNAVGWAKKKLRRKSVLTSSSALVMNWTCWNWWLLVMRLGYLHMTWKQNNNQCTVSRQIPQEQRKVAWFIWSSRSSDSFSNILGVGWHIGFGMTRLD